MVELLIDHHPNKRTRAAILLIGEGNSPILFRVGRAMPGTTGKGVTRLRNVLKWLSRFWFTLKIEVTAGFNDKNQDR